MHYSATPQAFRVTSSNPETVLDRAFTEPELALKLSADHGSADGVIYLRDVCLTLAAFVAAAPAAAHALVAGSADSVSGAVSSGVSSTAGGGGGLLAALQGVHDELAPALAAAVQRPKTPTQPATQVSCVHVML